MKGTSKHSDWDRFLRFYCDQNKGRLTRLGIFQTQNGRLDDYWIESGLPLTGIDIDTSSSQPAIQIMLGNLEHMIRKVRTIKMLLTEAGDEDGLDIASENGETTILRFYP